MGVLGGADGAGGNSIGEVHTNPLDLDPLVKEAYVHLYDPAGVVERFERFHEEHKGDPRATGDAPLEAIIFESFIARTCWTRTFFYGRNRRLLTGKHPTEEDPKTGPVG